MAIEKELIAKTPRGRPTRTPVGSRNRLAVTGKDSNYVYRIVNDSNADGQRLAQFKDAGYEFVSGDEQVGTHRMVATADGSVKSIPVGGGTNAYLMRIPKEYYVEDQQVKQRQVDESEQSMRQEAARDGLRGTISTSRD